MNINQQEKDDLGNVVMNENHPNYDQEDSIRNHKITLPKHPIIEDDEFWKDCLSNNLDKAIKPSQ